MAVDPVALRELRRRFQGQLLTPDEPGYDDARRVTNAMVDKRPAVGEDDTAFSNRHAQVDFIAVGRWTDPAADELLIGLCRDNWAALAHLADAGVYVNNLGQEDRVHEAYGEAKYRRLVALKDRFDPENLFHLNANIRPSTA